MPAVADGVPVRHVDPAAPWLTAFTPDPTASRLAAGALARFRLRFDDEKAGLVQDEEYELVLHPLDELVDVTAAVACDYDDRDLRTDAPAGARYVLPQAPVATKAWWTRLQRDLTDHVTRSRTIEVPRNTGLKLVGRPGETPEAFAERCRAAATERADAETATLRDKYEAKVRRLEQQLSAAEGRVDVLESERKGRLGQEVLGTAGSILGGFLGGRRNAGSILSSLGTAAGRRTRSAASAKRADAAQDRVEQLQAEHDRVEQELGDEVAAITERWDAVAAAVDTVAVALERTDVALAQLVLVWIPVPA
jgi:hypothetical protein